MNTSIKGRELHALAEKSRENQDFENALVYTDQATLAYEKDGDYLGMAEVQASRFLTFRHLFDKTEDKMYLMLAKFAAMAGVQIAKSTNQPQATVLPLYNLAKSQEALDELEEAIKVYKEAIQVMEQTPSERHNRPGVLADMKIHMGICEYKHGDKTALSRVETALGDLEDSGEYKYNLDVWLSGGYMKLAEVLRQTDSQKAREYLDKAKAVIDSNSELKLRLAQWEKLAAQF